LADVGFGYSQVLPILLAGLLTADGGAVIVEQPELHLNPALQVRIAEFFVSVARAGKQVLIETHGEHIVNTIRVLAAEDPTETISKLASVLYFQPTPTGPHVVDMNIREDGSVPEWPSDFFGESLNLSSRLMKAQRRFIKRGVSL
jgi:predicted ATPase